MKTYILFLILAGLMYHQQTNAQTVHQLDTLNRYKFQVGYSKGKQERAKYIAGMVNDATNFYQKQLGFIPTFKLLILDVDDWKIHALPAVYGMPHYRNDIKTLVVAADDNAFWRSFNPSSGQLPNELNVQVTKVYTTAKGDLSMQAFFDLLAIHELGHAFHVQAKLQMQRKWMGELYSNILLHTFIAEKKPALLPALTLFPKMVVATGTKGYLYTSLADAETHYNELGQKYPRNYGWYQCRWHTTAGLIYEASGKKAGKELWKAFKNHPSKLSDQELVAFLETADANVADMVKNWDASIVN